SELWRTVQSRENFDEYLAVIDSLQPKMEGEMAVEHLLRAGEIAARNQNNPEEGIRYYEKCLAFQSDNETALVNLSGLYEKTSRWQDLVKVLGKLAESSPNQMDRLRYLSNIGEVYEKKIRDYQLAIETFNEAFSIDETDMNLIESLERLYKAQNDHESLINILRRKADVRPENEGVINLNIGRILEEKLSSPERAIDHYEEMLRIDPANLDALGRLEVLYGERNNWEKLIEVYERLYDTVEKIEDRIRMATNLAILHEETLNEPLLAVEDLLKILDLEPSNSYAVGNLERLYTKLEQWNELINLYEQQVSVRDEKGEILRKIAEVYENRLNDVDAAIGTYRRALDIEPAVFAFEALERLYGAGEQWEDAVNVLTQWAKAGGDQEGLLMGAAEILYRKIENPVKTLK
ncbi:MAG: tetratricopeptide repeat protein, partial [Deltaproteobacteria bacterium]|nr:tetratricopeptide repeat protein [Deltaproteobacteria bacterium]